MRYLVPGAFGFALYLMGRRLGGEAAGAFLGVTGALLGWVIAASARQRRLRQAPAPPDPLPGETPRLHGPLKLSEAPGRRRDAWAYLSDRRLCLRPLDGGAGADLMLESLDEIRPGKRGWKGGELTLVFGRDLWRLTVPDAERWIAALRESARR